MGEPLDLQAMKEHARHCYPHAKVLTPDEFIALADRCEQAEKERDQARMALHNFASLHLPPEHEKPHKVADEDGLAWVKVLVQSAHPNTPCRLQVGFVRSLLDRLEEAERNRDELAEILALDEPEDEEPPCNDGPLLVGLNKLLKDAEAQRDEHLRNWQAAITEVDRARGERDRALVRAEAAEAKLRELPEPEPLGPYDLERAEGL